MFQKLGYKWTSVISVKPEELGYYANGKSMSFPDKTLIKKEGDPAIYKIENQKRKKFTSEQLFKISGGKWSNVIVLSDEEFSIYPDGGVVRYPDGTLLKEAGDDKIYVVKNGMAEWIKTAKEFEKAGYKWRDVTEVAAAELNL